jgi:hypothetical protein
VRIDLRTIAPLPVTRVRLSNTTAKVAYTGDIGEFSKFVPSAGARDRRNTNQSTDRTGTRCFRPSLFGRCWVSCGARASRKLPPLCGSSRRAKTGEVCRARFLDGARYGHAVGTQKFRSLTFRCHAQFAVRACGNVAAALAGALVIRLHSAWSPDSTQRFWATLDPGVLSCGRC